MVGHLFGKLGVNQLSLVCFSIPSPLDVKLVGGAHRRFRVEELDDLIDECIHSVLVFTVNLFGTLLKIC